MYYILYKTTNLINNKTYIGIHQTKKINDGYLGSGLAMKKAIKKYGEENFIREILEYCSSYYELLEKEKHYVSEEWIKEDTNYNLKTGGQSSGILSDESKTKISNTLKEKYKSGEIKPRREAPYIHTEEQNKQISETLKRKYVNGEIDRRLGRKTWDRNIKEPKEPWNKGKKGVQIGWAKGLILGPKSDEQKEKQSESLKKFYETHEHPTKGLPSWNKGMKMEQVACPNCGKLTDVANGKRWHFDKCKFILS